MEALQKTELPEPLEILAQAGVVIITNYFSDENTILLLDWGRGNPLYAIGPGQENLGFEYIYHLYNSNHTLSFIRKFGPETVIHIGHGHLNTIPRYFMYDTFEAMRKKFVPSVLEELKEGAPKLDDYGKRIRELKIVSGVP